MNAERMHDRLIYEQAAQWHTVMHGEPCASEREAFDRWLLESQRHIRNYLLVVALDRELTRMDPQRRVAIENLAAGAVSSSVIALERPLPVTRSGAAHPSRHPMWRWAAAACLVALLVLAFGTALQPWHGAGRYATAVGEQRIVKLDDGSVMYLNTDTRVQVRYSAGQRRIELANGEASFAVARDSSRPFLVAAGATSVQAIGTEFNVYRRERETSVSVIEGRVRVLSAEHPLALGAGEGADIGSNGKATLRKIASIGSAVAWRERRLVFRETALREIVAEFNRYNRMPRLRVQGTDAGARRYSGIFDAYDPGSLAQVLSADGDLRVDQAGDEIVVRPRATP